MRYNLNMKKEIIVISLGTLTIMGVIFLLPYYFVKPKDVQIAKPKEVNFSSQATNEVNIELDRNRENCKNTEKEFGTPSDDVKESFLYTTICLIDDNRQSILRQSLIRVYVRGAKNEFNKKIFETEESLYSWLLGPNSDVIHIRTSNRFGKDEMEYYFNRKGEAIEYPPHLETRYADKLPSPDKRYLARMLPPQGTEYKSKAIVEILNVFTGKLETFDFQKEVNEMEGISIDAWSPDSETLYITGSIYEFSAPAKLWAIDVKTKKVKKYDTKGYAYPVQLYPEKGVGLMTSGTCGMESNGSFVSSGSLDEIPLERKKFCTFKLARIDLKSGAVDTVTKEEAVASFRNLFLDGNDVYYEITDGFKAIDDDTYRNSSIVKKVDIYTGKSVVYSEDQSHILLIFPNEKKIILEKDNKAYIVSLADQSREYIGETHVPVLGANTLGEEYIYEFQGPMK